MEQDVGLWGTKRLASCKEQHWEDVETEGVDQCNMERINYSLEKWHSQFKDLTNI